MDIVLLILGILLLCGGLAGCIVPALPGPPMAFVAMILFNWSGYTDFTTIALVIWGIVMVGVTIVDFMLTPWMTKRFGGGKAGNWGATIGLITGILLPIPFGFLIGPFAGAYIGEKCFAKSDSTTSFKAACGAFLAFFVGTGLKLLYCIAVVVASVSVIWQSL